MRIAAIVLVGTLWFPSVSLAQGLRNYWGVEADVAPSWEAIDAFKGLFDADSMTFKGSGFRIGFVRGAILGGDWGVSFVRKRVDNASYVWRPSSACASCGTFLAASGNEIIGVEIHRFDPFATIKRRVQIGVDAAVGVGKLTGTVHDTTVSSSSPAVVQTSTQDVDAFNLIAPAGHPWQVMPLGRVELAVAGVIGPDLKVRASGGFEFPGYTRFSLGAIYLFGAR